MTSVHSGATQLAIGTIADGQILKRSGANVIGAIANQTGNPYIDWPATQNALDDEFASGSSDMATRGWICQDYFGAAMVRDGDIVADRHLRVQRRGTIDPRSSEA